MASSQPTSAELIVFRDGFNGSRILEDLYEAALVGKGTDMKFELEVTKLGLTDLLLTAHSAVVRSQSKVLDVMINETWAPKKLKEEIVVKLPVDVFEEFKLFLKFLYGHQHLTNRNFDVVIPAWKLADKYGADNVLALFVDYFDFLNDNLVNIDVCKLVLVAHEYKCEAVLDAAMAFVKANLESILEKTDWYEWPIEIVTDILCTDFIQVGRLNWNMNEYQIVFCAVKWLCNYLGQHTLTKPALNVLATKVLECVRFCQLDLVSFQLCMSGLHEFLTDMQISIITLVRFGVSEEKILARYGPEPAFKVDRRMRNASELR